MPTVNFKRNVPLLAPGSALGIDIKADASGDVLAALASPTAAFPDRDIDIASASLGFDGGTDVAFKAEGGKVAFKASAGGFAALGVYSRGAKVRELLKADEHVADGLTLVDETARRYVVLRFGYDLKGSAQGGMALGAGGAVTFGAEGAREGLFAVVRAFPTGAPARDVLQQAVDAWRLPRSVAGPKDIDPGTWLVGEVDGSVALTLGTTFGYDFNWVREAQLGGLSGDIGLKIQLGVAASVGFSAKGRYCVVVSRDSLDPASQMLRLRVYKLAYKGWTFAFSAAATVQAQLPILPDSADDFVKGVFGVKGAQIIKTLGAVEEWAGSDKPLPEVLAGLGSEYLQKLLTELTGIDAATAFTAARARLLDLLATWDRLPAKASSLVFQLIGERVDLAPVRAVIKKAAEADKASLQALLDEQVGLGGFFERPEGRLLESLAVGPLLGAVTNTAEFAAFKLAAQELDHLLDPQGKLLEVLVALHTRIEKTLGLDQLERVVTETDFAKLDALFQQKISEFLGRTFDFSDLEQVRKTIALLIAKKNEFYEKAVKALKRKYTFELAAAYERATTSTALIDAEFDFGHAKAGLDRLWKDALAGRFDTLFLTSRPDVTVHLGALTHGVTRHTHVELSFPFYKATIDHINRALAKSTVAEEEGGRVIVYELTAEDIVTTSSVLPWKKTQRDSRLTVGAFLPFETVGRRLRVHATDAMTYTYSFDQARTNMKRGDLQYQIKPLVARYFPGVFAEAASFDTWISDLDKTIDRIEDNGSDNFGNTLLTLDLTLPSRVPAAWLRAPADPRDTAYLEMSRSIQRALKTLMPTDFFQDRGRYDGAPPNACALMVFAAIPVSTDIARDGSTFRLNLPTDVHWDITDPKAVEAMIFNGHTRAALADAMKDVHDLLMSLGRKGDAAFYRPGELEKILQNAATGFGRTLLLQLLEMERAIVASARKAGLRLAEFRAQAGHSPKEAIEALEGFGSALTDAFNAKVSGAYGGGALRTLGTMLFVAAARGLSNDPGLRDVRPAGMLRLTVLRQGRPFPPKDFPNVTDLPAADVVVDQQFVSF